MAKIEADNREIEKALIGLDKAINENGGWLHPDLVMKCHDDGNLSIEIEGVKPGEKIIKLPADLLLPVKKLEITLKDGAFDFTVPNKNALIPVQHELAELKFNLYNLTHKAKYHEETNFWLSIGVQPDILDYIVSARTLGDNYTKLRDSAHKGFEGMDIEEYVCSDFIKSRVLGFKNKTASGEGKKSVGKGPHVIMPVIDFLNHHWRGSQFQNDQKSSQVGLAISCRQPIEGSNECYASYRPMDALDSFINYGFMDEYAPFVRSVPMEIQVPDLGRIVIKSRINLFNSKKLVKQAQDLRMFLPIMQKSYDIITASHLLIPTEGSPMALRRVLGILIARLVGEDLDRKRAMEFIRNAERTIIEQNIEFYDGLLKKVQESREEGDDQAALDVAENLAALQKRKIEGYQLITNEEAAQVA